MKTVLFLLGAFTITAGMTSDAAALSYLGPGRSARSAIVEDDDGGPREVRKGDVLPELGEIQTIDDDEIVIERILTEEERDKLKANGLLAPDVRRFRLYRLPEPHAAE
jgi:hypothetical protein